MEPIIKTYRQTRQDADLPRFEHGSAQLCTPVQFAKDLTLELGLAESLNLLNSYQIATNGLWLDMQQEGES